MKNILILLTLFLFSFKSFGISETLKNDNFVLGQPTSGNAKSFSFDFGLGVNNPKFLSTSGTDLNFNLPFNLGSTLNVTGDSVLQGNNLTVGDGTTSIKKFIFDKGAGVNNPYLGYNTTANSIVFNNGGIEKKIGSGGGGGGENFNNGFTDADNANAEDGLVGWTSTGGTFVNETVDPLAGSKSFKWTPALQNDTLSSNTLAFNRDVFKGRACEARIEYVGGDTNLTLEVVNGLNVVLASQNLPVHSIAGIESAFFLCPNQTDITANALNGNLTYRIKNTGVTASALIKFDSAYIGTLRGLTETTLPDVCSFTFNMLTMQYITQSGCNGLTLSKPATGTLRIDIAPGVYSVTPHSQCTVSNSSSTSGVNCIDMSGTYGESPTLKVLYVTSNLNVGLDSGSIHVTLTKQGADAKQSVQVYKSIPKVSENVNAFGFRAITGNPPNLQNLSVPNWVSCSYVSVGVMDCLFDVAMNLTQPMVCASKVWGVAASGTYGSSISNQTNLGFRLTAGNNNAPLDGIGSEILCTKTGPDFKLPTVQPILVNQVQSYESAPKVITGGYVFPQCTVSPCTLQASFGGVSNITRISTGRYSINFSDNKKRVCIYTDAWGVGNNCQENYSGVFTSSTREVKCVNSAAGLADSRFAFMCFSDL